MEPRSRPIKILIFEYISGGGFNRDVLPDALVCEGLLMLEALLEDLRRVPGLEVTLMLDARLLDKVDKAHDRVCVIGPKDDCFAVFRHAAAEHDAVWPIAPEFDAILYSLSAEVERLGKILLGSTAAAVGVAGNKFATYQVLESRQVDTVSTQMLEDVPGFQEVCVVKPVDGVGGKNCRLITNAREFAVFAKPLQGSRRYILQPHREGEKTSLSCLFKNGRAWVLSLNLQCFSIIHGCFHLHAIQVNCRPASVRHRKLANRIAEAIPGLWGYAGVDLIETPDRLQVLEINPRLTSSFAGLDSALGMNVAAAVIQLLDDEPAALPETHRTVTVPISKEPRQ